jgi:ketosteroid isomerase-like protein
MTDASPDSRLQIAQQLATHLGHRDFERFLEFLSPAVTYRVGGSHPLAGTYHGPGEVTDHMRDLVDRTKDTVEALQWEDWLVGQDHIAALVKIRAQGHGASFTARLMFLFGFDASNKVSEITVLFEDPNAVERFFGP